MDIGPRPSARLLTPSAAPRWRDEQRDFRRDDPTYFWGSPRYE
jgi:hypothetical protein